MQCEPMLEPKCAMRLLQGQLGLGLLRRRRLIVAFSKISYWAGIRSDSKKLNSFCSSNCFSYTASAAADASGAAAAALAAMSLVAHSPVAVYEKLREQLLSENKLRTFSVLSEEQRTTARRRRAAESPGQIQRGGAAAPVLRPQLRPLVRPRRARGAAAPRRQTQEIPSTTTGRQRAQGIHACMHTHARPRTHANI